MPSSIERIIVPLPDGFDPYKHHKALEALILNNYGPGFEIDSIDPKERTATATRQVAVTEVKSTKKNYFEVSLGRGTKPGDGEKVAVKLEDQHEGYTMTKFEPFLGTAVLTKLTDDERRCRGAVAVALGCKPWDIQVKSTADGGFDLELPKTYVASKHDDKLWEVAQVVVGSEGWWFSADAKTLKAKIVPGEPPTFPAAIPYPFEYLKDAPRDKVMLGHKLAKPGEEDGQPIWLDFEAAPHALVSGTSGSGKSVALSAAITGVLAGGSELAVIDVPHKALDFFWVRDLVRPGGWGCDSLRHSVACITMIYKEGERRAKQLADAGVVKWSDLPEAEQFKPIFVLVDEVTALIQLDDVPKGLPKEHPLVTEAQEANLLRQTLLGYMKRIAAEMRFVGIRLVLSSQVSSVNTGIPTALRLNLANKFLLGSSPTSGNRRLALSDPTSVPEVPEHVKRDSKASRGVGVAELEAQTPCVFKSFFATTEEMRRHLDELDLPTTDRWAPTPQEVARYTPSLEDSTPQKSPAGKQELAPSGRPAAEVAREMGDEYGVSVHDGSLGETPFERANAARHAAANPGKPTAKQKREREEEAGWAAQSGPVTTESRDER